MVMVNMSATIGNWSMFQENNILKLWKGLVIMEWWIDWSQGKTNTHLKNVFVGKIKMLSRDYFCKIKMYLPRKTTTGIGKRSVSFSSVRDKHSRLECKIISSKFGNCISTPKYHHEMKYHWWHFLMNKKTVCPRKD